MKQRDGAGDDTKPDNMAGCSSAAPKQSAMKRTRRVIPDAPRRQYFLSGGYRDLGKGLQPSSGLQPQGDDQEQQQGHRLLEDSSSDSDGGDINGAAGDGADLLRSKSMRRKVRRLCRTYYEPVELQVESFSTLALRIILLLFYAIFISSIVVEVIPQAQWQITNICGASYKTNLLHIDRWSSPCVTVTTSATGAAGMVDVRWDGAGLELLGDKLKRLRRIALSLPRPSALSAKQAEYRFTAEISAEKRGRQLTTTSSVKLKCHRKEERCNVVRLPEEMLTMYGSGYITVTLLGVPAELGSGITNTSAAVGVAYQRRSYTIGTVVIRYVSLFLSLLHLGRFIAYKKYTSRLYEQSWVAVLQFALFWYYNPLSAVNLVLHPLPSVLAFMEFRLPTYFVAITIAFMLSVMTASMKWRLRMEVKGKSVLTRYLFYSKNRYDPPMWTKIAVLLYVLAIFILDIIDAAIDTHSWTSGANSGDTFSGVFWGVIALLLLGALLSLCMLVYLKDYLGKKPYLETRPQQLACRVFLLVFFTSIIYYIIHYLVFFLYYNRRISSIASQQPLVQVPTLMMAGSFVNIMTLVYTTRKRDRNVPIAAADVRWKHMVWPDTWYRWVAFHGGSQYVFFTEEEETHFYKLQYDFRVRQYMAKQKRRGRRVHYDDEDGEMDTTALNNTFTRRIAERNQFNSTGASSVDEYSGADNALTNCSWASSAHRREQQSELHVAKEAGCSETRSPRTDREQTRSPAGYHTGTPAGTSGGYTHFSITPQPSLVPNNDDDPLHRGGGDDDDAQQGVHSTPAPSVPPPPKRNSTSPAFPSPSVDRHLHQTYNGGTLADMGVLNMDRFSTYFLPASDTGDTRRGPRACTQRRDYSNSGYSRSRTSLMHTVDSTGLRRAASNPGMTDRRILAATTGGGASLTWDSRDFSRIYGEMRPRRSTSALSNMRRELTTSGAPLVLSREPPQRQQHHHRQDRSTLTSLVGTLKPLHLSRSATVSPRVRGPSLSLGESMRSASHIHQPGLRSAEQSRSLYSKEDPAEVKQVPLLSRTIGRARDKFDNIFARAEQSLIVAPVKKFDQLESNFFNAALRPFNKQDYLPFFNLETSIDCYNMSWEAYGVTESAGDGAIQTGIEVTASNVPKTVAHGVKKVLCGCCAASDEEDEEGEETDEDGGAARERGTAPDAPASSAVAGHSGQVEGAAVQRPFSGAATTTVEVGGEGRGATHHSGTDSSIDSAAVRGSGDDVTRQSKSRKTDGSAENSGGGDSVLPLNVEKYGFVRLLVAEAKDVQVLMTKMDLSAPEHKGKSPRIVIAFRGTANTSNAKYDINLHRVVWREMERVERKRTDGGVDDGVSTVGSSITQEKYLGCKQCIRSCLKSTSWRPTVHAGFLSIWKSLKSIVIPRLVEELRGDVNTVYRVFTTGHSLGGALASLCAYSATQALLTMNYPITDVTTYTYGQPRIGNRTFMNIYERAVPRSFRIMNESDMVVTMTTFGGYHVGIQVNIDRSGNYIVKPTDIEKMFPPTQGRGLSLMNHLMANYGESINAIAARTPCRARCLGQYVKVDSEKEESDLEYDASDEV